MNTEETTNLMNIYQPTPGLNPHMAALALDLVTKAHNNDPSVRHDIGLDLAYIADNAADAWVNYTGTYLNHISRHKLKVIIGDALIEAIAPALGGEAVPRTSETPGPEATPLLSVESITPEALEKEGWENKGLEIYQKGRIVVLMCEGEFCVVEALTPSGNYAAPCQGVESMPDLRTLTRLINGE